MKKILFIFSFLLISCSEDLSQKAKDFSQNKIIIDSHIDTPFQIWRQKNNTGASDDITKRAHTLLTWRSYCDFMYFFENDLRTLFVSKKRFTHFFVTKTIHF